MSEVNAMVIDSIRLALQGQASAATTSQLLSDLARQSGSGFRTNLASALSEITAGLGGIGEGPQFADAALQILALDPSPAIADVLTPIAEYGALTGLARLALARDSDERVIAALGGFCDILSAAHRATLVSPVTAELPHAQDQEAQDQTEQAFVARAPEPETSRPGPAAVLQTPPDPDLESYMGQTYRPVWKYEDINLRYGQSSDAPMLVQLYAPLSDEQKIGRKVPPLLRLIPTLAAMPALCEGENISVQASGWLKGEVISDFQIAVRLGQGNEAGTQELMDLEAEIFAAPEATLMQYRARKTLQPDQGGQGWVTRVAHGISAFGSTVYDGCRELSKVYAHHLWENSGTDERRMLRWNGADLAVPMEMALALCSAIDLEKKWLGDGPRSAGQGPQDIRGAISPHYDLDHPVVMSRAVWLHFTSGLTIGDALKESLCELRFAQVCHVNAGLAPQGFDEHFGYDPGYPFGELIDVLGLNPQENAPQRDPTPF